VALYVTNDESLVALHVQGRWHPMDRHVEAEGRYR
jgi:hypothetical protein